MTATNEPLPLPQIARATASMSSARSSNRSSAGLTLRLCAAVVLLAPGAGFAADAPVAEAPAAEIAPVATPAETAPKSKYLPWDKVSARFGGFIAAFNSNLGFGIDNGPTVTVNGEDGLGLDSSLTVFRVDVVYRPGESRRHQLDFTYAAYHRRGTKTVSEEIDLGEEVIPVGATVETLFNFDIYRLTYSYAFLQDERMRIAMGLGVYAVPLEYGLNVETTGGNSRIEGADTTLPLPSLALRAEFQLIPRLFLDIEGNFMYLKISSFEGALADSTIGLEYRPWDHFGLGLAYSTLSVSVQADGNSSDYPGVDFIGSVDVRYNGLMLYGKLAF